jgi:hypothetical protein
MRSAKLPISMRQYRRCDETKRVSTVVGGRIGSQARPVGPTDTTGDEERVPAMHLHRFRRKARRRELEEEHQPKGEEAGAGGEAGEQPRPVVPAGVDATAPRERDSEWPWWLSSPATEGDAADRVSEDVGRPSPVKRDESDEPMSLAAA